MSDSFEKPFLIMVILAMQACFLLRRILSNKLDQDMYGLCSEKASLFKK